MKTRTHTFVFAALLTASLLAAPAVAQAQKANVTCTMSFNLKGWSVLYKKANGLANVSCTNGENAQVKIHVEGGGLTVGKTEVAGVGSFTGVRSINEIYGNYATSSAHAGAVKSGEALAMTKGEVSLGLRSVGRGWDVGFYFGKFVIEPAAK